MRVIWSPNLHCGAFADPVEGWFDLVSDRPPQDNVVGNAFDPLGVLVTTPEGEFLELEISLARFIQVTLEPPHPYSVATAHVSSHFEGRSAESYLDEETRTVLIQFESRSPDHWIRLGDSGVLLGLGEGEELRAIFCNYVKSDPGCIQLSARQSKYGF